MYHVVFSKLLRGLVATAGVAMLAAATLPASAGTPDQSACDVWKVACHYTASSREATYDISRVVIHKTEGATAAGAANWFANCSSGGSAHYTYDKANGYCYQSVREKDIAWHAGYGSTNNNSVGIEHSGWVASNDTSTACYDKSAIETRSCVVYYGVPCNRSYIIGHSEVPGCGTPGGGGTSCHTDPGRYWNWSYYMTKCSGGGVSTPGTTLRVGILDTGGNMSAKDGVYGAWFTQISGASAFQLEGNRIGVLCGGILFVKEGLTGGWVQMNSGGTASFQLCGNRIAALYNNGILACKDGMYGAWANQLDSVSSFDLEGNRIGAVRAGVLLVKEGLYGGWIQMNGGGTGSFQLCGDRIGALYNNGILSCKDGLYGGWVDQIDGVAKFHLDGQRIGVLCSGVLRVKEGLYGGWVQMNSGGTAAFQLSGNRIGALYSNGILSCKDGLYGGWADQTSGVSAFQLKGDRIAALCGGNMLYKEGMYGGWLTMAGNTVAKFQMQEY